MTTFRLLLALAVLLMAALVAFAPPDGRGRVLNYPEPAVLSFEETDFHYPTLAAGEAELPRGAERHTRATQNMMIGSLDVTIPPYEPLADLVYIDPLSASEPISDEPPENRARLNGTPGVIAGDAGELGRYPAGVQDQRFLSPTFDLPGTHTFRVTVRGAPWATPTDPQVTIAGNGQGSVYLDIDTRGLAPGSHPGTLVLTCVGGDGHVVEIPIGIDVPHPPLFGAHPADGQFGGLDATGQPKPLADLIGDVIDALDLSPFGRSSNGGRVVAELRSWEGYFDFAVTTDAPAIGNRAPQPRFGTAPDGDVVSPGEGQYVYSVGSGPLASVFASEEFILGIDQSSKGIDEARRRPGDFYVFTYDGKMGVVPKADLAHTLPHEGLHALHGGDYNVGGGASNQEERDAFEAGNAGAQALGLPVQTDAPGYGATNPNYVPLFPTPAPPRTRPPAPPPDPAGLPDGYAVASVRMPFRVVRLLDSPAIPEGTEPYAVEHVVPLVVRSFEGVEMFVASRGGSTGPVLDLYVVNHTADPVRLTGEGIVLEPVEDPGAADLARVQAIREAASGGKPLAPRNDRPVPGGSLRSLGTRSFPVSGNVVRIPLDGYCLDLRQDVPAEGLLFRIASRDRQDGHADERAILAAGRRIHAAGRLTPDSDPDAYYHSIRQWAIWTRREALDRRGFEDAFVEHTRKNFTAAGGTWTDDVERRVRELAPNRWADLTAILEDAGL